MGYGKYYCWIGNSVGSAVFLAVPMAAVLLLNTVLYIMTVASINHVAKAVRNKQAGGETTGPMR
jgi:hypothetical protein